MHIMGNSYVQGQKIYILEVQGYKKIRIDRKGRSRNLK